MEENNSSGNKKKGSSSPVRQRQRSNRASYNNWASQRNRAGNHVNQQGSEDSSERNSAGNDFTSPSDSTTEARASSSISPQAFERHPTAGGLNSIRQLLDDIETASPSMGEANIGNDNAQTSSSSGNSINNAVNINNNSGGNRSRSTNSSSNQHNGNRLRHRRRLPPNQNPVGSRAVGTSNNAGPGRNQSPSRQNRSQAIPGHRIPPLRLFDNPPSPGSPPMDSPASESMASPVPSNLFRSVRPIGPRSNPFLRGLGTEEEPYELSPGLPDVPSSPSAFSGAGNMLSDEEIALQLQQEEWEAADTYRQIDAFADALQVPFNMFHHPSQRPRLALLPPIRRRPRGDNSRHYGGPGAPGLRPPGRANRGRGAPTGMRTPTYMGEVDPAFMDSLFAYDINDDIDNVWAFITSYNDGMGEMPDYEGLLALAEEVGDVSKGMSEDEINRIPTKKHSNSSNAKSSSPTAAAGATAAATPGATAAEEHAPQCNICLNDYENGDLKRLLPCEHDFHKDCVDQWLKSNATCPVCRSDVKRRRS